MNNEVKVGIGMQVVFGNVKISGLSMKKQDKELGNEISDNHDAESGTVTALVKKFPDSFAKPISSAGTKVYEVYKKHGIRLAGMYAIPVKKFVKFQADLKEAVSVFELQVSNLRDAVQTGELARIADAQQGTLAPEKPITVKDVDRTFSVHTTLQKNTNCIGIDDALAILGTDIVEMIEAEHVKAIEQAKKDAVNAPVKVMAEKVQEWHTDLVKKCTATDTKGTQWKTVIKHISDLIAELPTYNVTNNPAVDAVIAEMKEKLGNLKEYELKHDEIKRKDAVTIATDVATKFAGMFVE